MDGKRDSMTKTAGVAAAMVLAAAGAGYLMSGRDVPTGGTVAGSDDCPYCVFFDPRTRMRTWVNKLGRPCDPGWTAASDQAGTPCGEQGPTPAATLPPVASPTPGGSPTPAATVAPTVRPATRTATPAPGAWSLTLPAQGYRVVIECPPGACWIDGQTAAWVLTGPWTLRMEPMP